MADSPAFKDAFYSAPDGLKLHARIYGAPSDSTLPVVCLPGLTRNARDFHDLALVLSGDPARPRRVIAFDYRGRGLSAYDPDWKNYTVAIEAGDIVAGLTALGIEHAAFIGTSRGGLIIHVLAAIRPAAAESRRPQRHRAGGRRRRPGAYPRLSRAGAETADVCRRRRHPARRAWVGFRCARGRRLGAHGRCALSLGQWRADTGFRSQAAEYAQGFRPQQAAARAVAAFEGLAAIPLLAIRGANSKLLSAKTLAEMARPHPDCQAVTVDGQGHAPMLETGALPQMIRDFIGRAEQRVPH